MTDLQTLKAEWDVASNAGSEAYKAYIESDGSYDELLEWEAAREVWEATRTAWRDAYHLERLQAAAREASDVWMIRAEEARLAQEALTAADLVVQAAGDALEAYCRTTYNC